MRCLGTEKLERFASCVGMSNCFKIKIDAPGSRQIRIKPRQWRSWRWSGHWPRKPLDRRSRKQVVDQALPDNGGHDHSLAWNVISSQSTPVAGSQRIGKSTSPKSRNEGRFPIAEARSHRTHARVLVSADGAHVVLSSRNDDRSRLRRKLRAAGTYIG